VGSIDEQTWEDFSATWNTDVKAGLVGIQAALKTPMKPGGRVLIMSSGAAMALSVPFIAPESLRLSGGYTGAKRMLWFMAHSANAVARERGLTPFPSARARATDTRHRARAPCGPSASPRISFTC
jgi:NAD(P)-dependent dehydrogenase (short-subunit alcohol dehydrogenase family)